MHFINRSSCFMCRQSPRVCGPACVRASFIFSSHRVRCEQWCERNAHNLASEIFAVNRRSRKIGFIECKWWQNGKCSLWICPEIDHWNFKINFDWSQHALKRFNLNAVEIKRTFSIFLFLSRSSSVAPSSPECKYKLKIISNRLLLVWLLLLLLLENLIRFDWNRRRVMFIWCAATQRVSAGGSADIPGESSSLVARTPNPPKTCNFNDTALDTSIRRV